MQTIRVGPWSIGHTDPVTFLSYLVGHRVERLVQCGDLVVNALICVEAGGLLPAAASARSALEIAAMCFYVESKLSPVWDHVHGNADSIRQVVLGQDQKMWDILVRIRVGSKLLEDPAGREWPKPVHVNDAFKAMSKINAPLSHLVDITYARLCDAIHPSIGVQDAMWRRGGLGRLGEYALRFSPTRSESPTRVDILSAVTMACNLVIDFARFLWWVAADISLAFQVKDVSDTRMLGVPTMGRSTALCCCGSGTTFHSCTHPRPDDLFGEDA